MKKILIFLSLIVAIISISACSEDPNVLEVSKSSDEIVGENYQTIISELEETGFTNIETKILDDLITGFLTKDGEIEKIEINGETEFSVNDSFKKDAKIVITYHTFPKREKKDTGSTDKSSKKEEKGTESTDKKSSDTGEKTTNDTSSERKILTVNNNEELAAVLAVKDPSDPIVGEFAKKYAGKTIEFDGNIADMMQNRDYKTRYDILIYAGDYSETTAIGPSFKFEDVNVSDLKLTGSDIPENIGMGQNLHITAVVKKYNEDSGLFMLKPVSTKIR
ncbi:MAG: DUF4839 domain-containing protein [Thermotaleaceae bacterium]